MDSNNKSVPRKCLRIGLPFLLKTYHQRVRAIKLATPLLYPAWTPPPSGLIVKIVIKTQAATPGPSIHLITDSKLGPQGTNAPVVHSRV